MVLNISSQSGIIERGVYRFGLSEYPNIKLLELKNLVQFILYEKSYGRKTEIVCEDKRIIDILNEAVASPETVKQILLPETIGDGSCACNHRVCLTEFVCHTTSLESAKKILSCGKLLSAVKAYGKTGEELSYEKRDSLWNDPADVFEYIMFYYGNCIFGDYVVISDLVDGDEMADVFESGHFDPGVRFYFTYRDIIRHPGHAFDGYHVIKVKDEIVLPDYLHACVVPEQYKNELQPFVLPVLESKVHYLAHHGLGLCDWTEKMYDCIKEL